MSEVETLLNLAQSIESKIRSHIQNTQQIKKELSQLNKEFIENATYLEQRDAQLELIREEELKNDEAIKHLQKQLVENKESVANFEEVYEAMLTSEDYIPHINIEKKLKRIQLIKNECKRIEESLK